MAETKTDAQKADEQARAEEQKALEARAAAERDPRTDEEKKADAAAAKADDKRAEAERLKDEEGANDEGATTAAQAKGLSAIAEPDRAIGDHHAQKFSHTPENPQLAHGLNPDAEGKVKLVLETSDTLAAGEPNVCYVHPEMVGDYLRAGWSRG
jgi:hypothetical protein